MSAPPVQRLALLVRLAVGFGVVIAAVSTVAAIPGRGWEDPEPSLTASRSAVADRTVRSIEEDGVRFTSRQEDALRRLVGLWERRDDLRGLFVTGTGDPDLPALIGWAGQDNDPDALQLAIIRPALSEAAARLGMLDPGGGIVGVLVQTAAMRPEPRSRLGGALWLLADAWKRREDLRSRFSNDGIVDVRGLYTWASAVPVDDPDTAVFSPVSGDFDRLVDELPPRRAGTAAEQS